MRGGRGGGVAREKWGRTHGWGSGGGPNLWAGSAAEKYGTE